MTQKEEQTTRSRGRDQSGQTGHPRTTGQVHALDPKHRRFLIKAQFFCSVPETTPTAPMIHYPSVVRPGLGGALPPGNHYANGIQTGTATTSGSPPNHTLFLYCLEDQKTS